MFLSSFDPRRARRTDGRRGARARFGGWGRVLQNKGWPSFGNPSGDMKSWGITGWSQTPLNRRNLQGLLSHSRPRWLSSPAKPLVSKLGIIRRQMMGHLKFWRGSPYPVVRPFRSEDGGMMRAEDGRKGRTRDPENGQSWGSRKRGRKRRGGKRPSKYFDT